jgi:hypothetical protein
MCSSVYMFVTRPSQLFCSAICLPFLKQLLQCQWPMSLFTVSLVVIHLPLPFRLLQGWSTACSEWKCLHLSQCYLYLTLLHILGLKISYLRTCWFLLDFGNLVDLLYGVYEGPPRLYISILSPVTAHVSWSVADTWWNYDGNISCSMTQLASCHKSTDA